METFNQIKAIPLKQVKTVDDLKQAIGNQQLVMHSCKQYSDVLDGRVKSFGNWSRLFIIKVINGEFRYIYTTTNELKYWSEITNSINDSSYNRFDSTSYGRPKEEVIELKVLNLFLYNLKKGNTMYVTDSFIPQEIKTNLKNKLDAANEYLKLANKKLQDGYGIYDVTEKFKHNYKRIPKNTVISNRGDRAGIVYAIKGKQYRLLDEYKRQLQLAIADRDINLRTWAEYSNTYNINNNNWSVFKLPNKDKREMHQLLENAVNLQAEVRKEFHTWYAHLYADVKCK